MAHPFSSVPEGKLESLNALQAEFREDVRLNKVDLMCGVYQTEDGKPYVLPSVKLARQILIDDPDWEHEYPSSHLGEASFRHHSLCLQYGSDSQQVKEQR
ncbi:hypothetical protein E4T52_05719 [Aureobasidium sp. EXF-3400]|nr:hypothetical protein E4T52_05719 [Aureobasidium sp. EXF-3400]